MIFFITYNDHPSGVFWSQVTDVVDHMDRMGKERVQLVAMVSLRQYFRTRSAIRERHPGALVVPMVPRAHNWRINWIWLYFLCLKHRPSGIIGRGIFASALGLRMRDMGLTAQVCFDARAAYGSEWEEFRVVDDDRLIAECAALEREVVNRSDLRMAVSEALVQHWRDKFGYHAVRHVVIPCTLGRQVEAPEKEDSGHINIRRRLRWGNGDIVLAYSGTVVGWQSLELMRRTLGPWLRMGTSHRVLFLSQEHPVIEALKREFPDQVERAWLEHREVRSILTDCDYGLLLRDACVTNRVASPTKFAEYLSAGLPVVISEDVGDLSAMVRTLDLGHVLVQNEPLQLSKPDQATRERLMGTARSHFMKEAFNGEYTTVLRHLDPVYVEWSGKGTVPAADNGPLVSFIVPSYNKRTFIGDMVHTILVQTERRWELIIVDDASTDGSVEQLREMTAADARVRIIQLKENKGANYCRNLGIEQARAPYVIFVDADDLLGPDCLANRLRSMQGSGLDFAVFTLEVFRNSPGDHGQLWVPDTKEPLKDFFRHKLPWQTMQPIWDRGFLERLHGFDGAFSRHQDVELHTRALLQQNVNFRLWPSTPDCYYRIAEERKVIDPMRLLSRFSESAVLYREKFLAAAKQLGCPDLLLGIIHRTYLQILLHAKDGRISAQELHTLEGILLARDWTDGLPAFKRWIFRFTRWYNLMAIRVPGVNLVMFRLLTASWPRSSR